MIDNYTLDRLKSMSPITNGTTAKDFPSFSVEPDLFRTLETIERVFDNAINQQIAKHAKPDRYYLDNFKYIIHFGETAVVFEIVHSATLTHRVRLDYNQINSLI